MSDDSDARPKALTLPPFKPTTSVQDFRKNVNNIIVEYNRKVENPFISMVFALHMRTHGHRVAGVAAGEIYIPPDATLIADWSACVCAG